MAGAAGQCPFPFHSESRRCCRKWAEGNPHMKWNPTPVTTYFITCLEFLSLVFCIYFLRVCVTGESGTLVESGLKKWARGGGPPPPIPSLHPPILLRTERMHCTAPLAAAPRVGCPYPLAVRSVGQLSIV